MVMNYVVTIDIDDGISNPNSTYCDPLIVKVIDQNTLVEKFINSGILISISPDILNSIVIFNF